MGSRAGWPPQRECSSVGSSEPEARLPGGRGLVGHSPHGVLALLPDPVKARAWRFRTFDPVDGPEGPQLEKSSSARQCLPDLTEEEDLRGPEQEEAAALASEQPARVDDHASANNCSVAARFPGEFAADGPYHLLGPSERR